MIVILLKYFETKFNDRMKNFHMNKNDLILSALK
jgi:hypothetical protein